MSEVDVPNGRQVGADSGSSALRSIIDIPHVPMLLAINMVFSVRLGKEPDRYHL